MFKIVWDNQVPEDKKLELEQLIQQEAKNLNLVDADDLVSTTISVDGYFGPEIDVTGKNGELHATYDQFPNWYAFAGNL